MVSWDNRNQVYRHDLHLTTENLNALSGRLIPVQQTWRKIDNFHLRWIECTHGHR